MEQIITKDNSITFFNEQYQETYHSKSGAEQEAIKKFVEPCKDKTNPNILDLCFGIGYNSAAAIDFFKDCNIIALENDKKIINQIPKLNPKFKSYNEIKQLAKTNKTKHIMLLLGDARTTIKKLKQKFDIIFLDPFSPKKCPELWTETFLKYIYNLTKSKGILTTYSCARIVRDNLTKVGFKIEDGPVIGRRAPSTIARKP